MAKGAPWGNRRADYDVTALRYLEVRLYAVDKILLRQL
jgi:hypothetical protein